MSTRRSGRGCRSWRHTGSRSSRASRAAASAPSTASTRRPTSAPSARPSRGPGSRDGRVWRGKLRPSPGVQDDRSDNRVLDMDTEGADRHFLVPSAWTAVRRPCRTCRSRSALIRAYHRHMEEFCGVAPDRLKGPIVASTRNVEEAVREIRDWGKSKWAVAVQPLLDNDTAGRSPRSRTDLAGRRGARSRDRASQLRLERRPISPATSDMWDNVYIARLCSHPWGAMRFMAGFLAGGILDRHPGLRLCGARMRLRLAAVLGAADGRTGQLCRPHRPVEAAAERAVRRRPRVLQHRGARARADVPHGDTGARRRRA